jgi:hypothetical protein
MKINKLVLGLGAVAVLLASCESQEATYSDFDYQTVYFANRYPVRTLELGEDPLVDISLDNEKKVEIKATTGGVYENKNNISIDYIVDPTLCDNLYFTTGGNQVLPMPADYYQLASNKLSIPSGSIMGGVQVTLTDAFFADPNSVKNTYVIPLLMTEVNGAVSILQGTPLINNPSKVVDSHWSVFPRNFVLYAVKYVNPWHGNYLRRGADVITTAGVVSTKIRHELYVEKNELVAISTNSLTTNTLPVSITDNANKKVNINLILTFADDQTCTVSGSSATAPAYTVSGTGKFVKKGDKNSIGGKECNALYLDYKVDLATLNLTYETKDTLVVRDRGVYKEYFTVTKK